MFWVVSFLVSPPPKVKNRKLERHYSQEMNSFKDQQTQTAHSNFSRLDIISNVGKHRIQAASTDPSFWKHFTFIEPFMKTNLSFLTMQLLQL